MQAGEYQFSQMRSSDTQLQILTRFFLFEGKKSLKYIVSNHSGTKLFKTVSCTHDNMKNAQILVQNRKWQKKGGMLNRLETATIAFFLE